MVSFVKRCAPILVLLLCLWPALARAQATEDWTSVRAHNFLLVGNASEREIQQVAARLELFRHAFTRLFDGARFDSRVPTTVIVFRDHESYRPSSRAIAGSLRTYPATSVPGKSVTTSR